MANKHIKEQMINSIFPMRAPLINVAEIYEKEAEAQKDKFNKGYFEGMAEMARLAVSCLGVADESLITDIINGDA